MRAVPSALAWSFVLAAAQFAACGGSDDTSNFAGATTGGSSITAQAACAEYADALCKKLDGCVALFLQIGFGDVATCSARVALSCPSVFDADGTTTTPDHLDACAKAVGGSSCEDLLNHVVPAACEATPGKLPDGSPCSDDGQCSHAYCKKAQESTCGACSTHVGEGAACTSGFLSGNDCEGGLVCFNDKCATPLAAGATCGPTAPCGGGLYCKGDGASGVCTAHLELGAACDPMMDREACNLGQGRYCDPMSNTCVAVGTADAGEPCGAVGGKLVVCIAGGTCTEEQPKTGTCVAPAEDGKACNPANKIGCKPLAKCTGGVCTLPGGGCK